MSKLYTKLVVNGLVMGLVGFLSCNQEPTLPDSIIPTGCRLGLATYINETYTDSVAYQYDTFGHLTQISTVHKERGRITRQAITFYGYTPDHYLTSRTDRITTYTNGLPSIMEGAYVYEYQGEPKQIQAIRRVSGTVASDAPWTSTYQYNGSQLTRLTEVSAANSIINQVTIGSDGRPTQIQRPNYQVINLADGLISRTINNKDTVRYTYDSQRQLTTQILSYGTTGERIEKTFTYDGRQPTRTGELRLKGFPERDLSGYGQSQSNLLTETTRRFRSGFLIDNTTVRYTYAYNAQGYVTGYARSDGARARFYYTNCP